MYEYIFFKKKSILELQIVSSIHEKENNALKQAIEGASGAISGLPEESYFNVLIFGSNV